MAWLKISLIVLQLIISLVLIIVVLLQPSKTAGLSQSISGGETETFFGKNGGSTYESIMKRVTSVCAILFLLTSIALSIFAL
ncbi:MAG: preprotein translocase subunit SecG [Clostridiales bacterium]|jgi:preprotein translocase subunit SecG|nr:preprotein translocase subunit SecG [Clostridiales bacterium]